MSKVDDILADELDPEDLNSDPRGGKHGRGTEDPKTAGKSDFRVAVPPTGPACLVRAAQLLGFAGIAVATVLAAVAGWAG
ncbi:hypothetical protein [Amycolatopsis tolypomycina]|uniref:hypothetical protein n=1 Tax=Amycolatopsis tolypomycina TaxID=208445 RepID=UPI0033B2362D